MKLNGSLDEIQKLIVQDQEKTKLMESSRLEFSLHQPWETFDQAAPFFVLRSAPIPSQTCSISKVFHRLTQKPSPSKILTEKKFIDFGRWGIWECQNPHDDLSAVQLVEGTPGKQRLFIAVEPVVIPEEKLWGKDSYLP